MLFAISNGFHSISWASRLIHVVGNSSRNSFFDYILSNEFRPSTKKFLSSSDLARWFITYIDGIAILLLLFCFGLIRFFPYQGVQALASTPYELKLTSFFSLCYWCTAKTLINAISAFSAGSRWCAISLNGSTFHLHLHFFSRLQCCRLRCDNQFLFLFVTL